MAVNESLLVPAAASSSPRIVSISHQSPKSKDWTTFFFFSHIEKIERCKSAIRHEGKKLNTHMHNVYPTTISEEKCAKLNSSNQQNPKWMKKKQKRTRHENLNAATNLYTHYTCETCVTIIHWQCSDFGMMCDSIALEAPTACTVLHEHGFEFVLANERSQCKAVQRKIEEIRHMSHVNHVFLFISSFIFLVSVSTSSTSSSPFGV